MSLKKFAPDCCSNPEVGRWSQHRFYGSRQYKEHAKLTIEKLKSLGVKKAILW